MSKERKANRAADQNYLLSADEKRKLEQQGPSVSTENAPHHPSKIVKQNNVKIKNAKLLKSKKVKALKTKKRINGNLKKVKRAQQTFENANQATATTASTNSASVQNTSQAPAESSKPEQSLLSKIGLAIVGAFTFIVGAIYSPVDAFMEIFFPVKDSPKKDANKQPDPNAQANLQANAAVNQNYASHPQPGQGYQTPLPNQQNGPRNQGHFNAGAAQNHDANPHDPLLQNQWHTGPQNHAYFNDQGELTKLHLKGSDFEDYMRRTTGVDLSANALLKQKDAANQAQQQQPSAASTTSATPQASAAASAPTPNTASTNNRAFPTSSAPTLEDTLSANNTNSIKMPSFASATANPPAYAPTYPDLNAPVADAGTAPSSAQQNITSAPMGSFTGPSTPADATPGADASPPAPSAKPKTDTEIYKEFMALPISEGAKADQKEQKQLNQLNEKFGNIPELKTITPERVANVQAKNDAFQQMMQEADHKLAGRTDPAFLQAERRLDAERANWNSHIDAANSAITGSLDRLSARDAQNSDMDREAKAMMDSFRRPAPTSPNSWAGEAQGTQNNTNDAQAQASSTATKGA